MWQRASIRPQASEQGVRGEKLLFYGKVTNTAGCCAAFTDSLMHNYKEVGATIEA